MLPAILLDTSLKLNNMLKKISIALLAVTLASCNDSERIDKFVNSIKTLPVKQDQTIVSQPSPPSQQVIDGVRYTCSSTDNTQTATPDEVVAFNPNTGVLYPGALVKGTSLNNGILTGINVKRNSGKITVSFFNPKNTVERINLFDLKSGIKETPSENPSKITKSIPEATFQTVSDAIRELTNKVPAGSQVARIKFEKTEFHTLEQSFLSTGLSVSWLSGSVKAQLSTLNTSSKSKYFVKVIQPYYDISFETDYQSIQKPSSFISSKTKFSDFQKAIGDTTGNPPAYVKSISYGRLLLFFIESSASQEELNATMEATFSGAFVGGSANLTLRQKEIVNSSAINVVSFGGSADATIDLLNGDKLNGLQKYLKDGANYDPQKSPGYPITYVSRYLKNDEVAKLSYTTNFKVEKCVRNPTKVSQLIFDINLTTDDKDREDAVEFWIIKGGNVTGHNIFGQGTKWGDPGKYPCVVNVNDITVDDLPLTSVRMLKTAGCGGPRGCGMEGFIDVWYITEYGQRALWFQIPNRRYGDDAENDVWLKR